MGSAESIGVGILATIVVVLFVYQALMIFVGLSSSFALYATIFVLIVALTIGGAGWLWQS